MKAFLLGYRCQAMDVLERKLKDKVELEVCPDVHPGSIVRGHDEVPAIVVVTRFGEAWTEKVTTENLPSDVKEFLVPYVDFSDAAKVNLVAEAFPVWFMEEMEVHQNACHIVSAAHFINVRPQRLSQYALRIARVLETPTFTLSDIPLPNLLEKEHILRAQHIKSWH